MLNYINTKEVVITTKRKYASQNVYDALQNRFQFIFKEFDNIFVSFSGGKDSGLLLNLTLDFQKKFYPNKKLVFFIRISRRNILPRQLMSNKHLPELRMMSSLTGYAFLWRPEQHSATMRCSGIPGTIPKKTHGCALCQTIHM